MVIEIHDIDYCLPYDVKQIEERERCFGGVGLRIEGCGLWIVDCGCTYGPMPNRER